VQEQGDPVVSAEQVQEPVDVMLTVDQGPRVGHLATTPLLLVGVVPRPGDDTPSRSCSRGGERRENAPALASLKKRRALATSDFSTDDRSALKDDAVSVGVVREDDRRWG